MYLTKVFNILLRLRLAATGFTLLWKIDKKIILSDRGNYIHALPSVEIVLTIPYKMSANFCTWKIFSISSPPPPQQKSEGPNLEKFPLAHMKYPICGLDSDPP